MLTLYWVCPGFPPAPTAGWTMFPSQRRRTWWTLLSSKKVRAISHHRFKAPNPLRPPHPSFPNSLMLSNCRWPSGVRQRAAGAELGGSERDPAGAAGSCHIGAGVFGPQTPGAREGFTLLKVLMVSSASTCFQAALEKINDCLATWFTQHVASQADRPKLIYPPPSPLRSTLPGRHHGRRRLQRQDVSSHPQ